MNFQSNSGYNIVLYHEVKQIDKVHKSVCVERINVDTTEESVVKQEYKKLIDGKEIHLVNVVF